MFTHPDEDFRSGSVPWDAKECASLLEFATGLLVSPKDDWDLSSRPVSGDFSFNMFNSFVQISLMAAQVMNDKQNLVFHLYRLERIIEFVSENKDVLVRHGLVLHSDGDNKISQKLIEVLCVLRYMAPTRFEGVFTFDLQSVIDASTMG